MAISNEYECTAGDSCYDGTVFKFDSVSSRLNTSLPLADQTALVPGGASLIIYGETESGKIMRNRIWWTYQLENCGRDTNPVQVDDKVGWVTVRDVASAWPAFCKRALGNPTIAPAEYEPTTTPSTPAPIDTANPQPSNPTPTGSTPAPTAETNPLLPTYPTLSPKPTLSMKPTPLNTSTSSNGPTSTSEPCVAYLISKSSKKSNSKSSKSTKSCKSAKSNTSWSKPHSMSLGLTVKERIKGRPKRIFSGASSRIKLHNYEVSPTEDSVEKMNNTNQASSQSQSFAPAWELMAMFVLAAALMGWRFRYPYASQEVIATQQATEGDIQDMSDDEEDIDDDDEEEEEEEEVSTSEDTEYIADAIFNRTLQLINCDFDDEEAGDGSVGFFDDETDELEDVDFQQPTQHLVERSELELL